MCDVCQRRKDPGRGHGELPPKTFDLEPFKEVAVDCIGPWRVPYGDGDDDIDFNAMMMSCMATTYPEIGWIIAPNPTSQERPLVFENQWLSRHPKPSSVILDQGSKFKGHFQEPMLLTNGIIPQSTTSKNPQAKTFSPDNGSNDQDAN